MAYHIRTASFDEMQWVIAMAEQEGWLPGYNDPSAFYQADPTGFYVGCLAQRPISCISAQTHDFLSARKVLDDGDAPAVLVAKAISVFF